jgi:hypothetical protein
MAFATIRAATVRERKKKENRAATVRERKKKENRAATVRERKKKENRAATARERKKRPRTPGAPASAPPKTQRKIGDRHE